jgi:hypothetical protein
LNFMHDAQPVALAVSQGEQYVEHRGGDRGSGRAIGHADLSGNRIRM